MYAIVDIRGQQFKVEKNQQIFVHRLNEKEGAKIIFDKVFLFEDSGKISVGDPIVSGIKVSAEIIEHLKDEKVIVFKKKRRKGYKVKNGHRQHLTKLEIKDIGNIKSPAKKVTTKKATTEKPTTKEPTTKKVTAKKATTKKATAKKATTKKAIAKKVTTKKTVANKDTKE